MTKRDDGNQYFVTILNMYGASLQEHGEHASSLEIFELALRFKLVAINGDLSTTYLKRDARKAIAGGKEKLTMLQSAQNKHSDNNKDPTFRSKALRDNLLLIEPAMMDQEKLVFGFTKKERSMKGQPDASVILIIRHNIASANCSMGKINEALRFFNCVRESGRRQIQDYGHTDMAFLSALNNIGHILSCHGKVDNAFKVFQEALAWAQAALSWAQEEPGHSTPLHRGLSTSGRSFIRQCISTISCNKGCMYLSDQDYANALDSFSTALIHAHTTSLLDVIAVSLNDVGHAYQDKGMHQEATHAYKLTIKTRAYFSKIGESDPRCAHAVAHFNVGIILLETGNHEEEAIHALRCALWVKFKVLGCFHPDVASLLYVIGSTHMKAGQLGEALTYFKRALTVRRYLFGDEDKVVSEVLYRIGCIHQEGGEYSEALTAFRETLEVERAVLKHNHSDIATTLCRIGEICHLLGTMAEATEAYTEAVQIMMTSVENGESDFHQDIANTFRLLGDIQLLHGHHIEAEEAYGEAFGLRVGTSDQEEALVSQFEIETVQEYVHTNLEASDFPPAA